MQIKRIMFLLGAIFFGYVGIVLISMGMNDGMVNELKAILIVVGSFFIYIMRLLWKKFKMLKSK